MHIGASSCTACPAGKYNEKEAQAECTLCAGGKYATLSGATTSLVCVACPTGKLSSSDRSYCGVFACIEKCYCLTCMYSNFRPFYLTKPSFSGNLKTLVFYISGDCKAGEFGFNNSFCVMCSFGCPC